MKQLILASASMLLLLSPAFAEKTYTPAQLRSMFQSGKLPKQGSPTTQTKAMDFESCVVQVKSIVQSVQPNYPTSTILSTNSALMEKVWTNDAAMTMSCSAPDGKLVITSSPYQ